MAFKEIIKFLRKRLIEISTKKGGKNIIFSKKYYALYVFFLVIFFTYTVFLNQINSYSELKEKNLNTLFQSNEVAGLKRYFLDSISSPYKEYQYIIQNNDSIEKILNKYKGLASLYQNCILTKEIKITTAKPKKILNIWFDAHGSQDPPAIE